jgi:hypothetical protein
MHDERVREYDRYLADLPSQLDFPSTTIERQFELPNTQMTF